MAYYTVFGMYMDTREVFSEQIWESTSKRAMQRIAMKRDDAWILGAVLGSHTLIPALEECREFCMSRSLVDTCAICNHACIDPKTRLDGRRVCLSCYRQYGQ